MPSDWNIEDFINSLDEQYIPAVNRGAKRGIERFAAFTIGNAMALCPQSPSNPKIPGAGPPHGKDEIKNPRFTGHSGALRDSGDWEAATGEASAGSLNVVVSFNTFYAVFVHEDPDAFHPVGQWKFLETAMRQDAPHMMEIVKQAIDEEMAK